LSVLAGTTEDMLLATLLAAAAWTTPAPLELPDYGATASGAFGGSAIGTFGPTATIARRSGAGFTPFAPITAEDPRERVEGAGLSDAGEAVVATVRRGRPTRRIRATIVAPDGTRGAVHTISDGSHTSTRPQLAVGADGTAVAAWAWHDPGGWRVQAAVRRPGQPRFDPPQNVSPPISRLSRWLWIDLAAGTGGHVALTWFYGGAEGLAVRALRLRSTGPDGRFSADQAMPGQGGWYDVALAVGPAGALSLAYRVGGFGVRVPRAKLRASTGTAGGALSAPVVLASGGRGLNSGRSVVTAFSAEGGPIVAWLNPGDGNDEGGALQIFVDGETQILSEAAKELSLAGGPGRSAVLGWTDTSTDEVHAAIRPQAGGGFGPDTKIADGASPAVAMTPAGEAIAVWHDAVAFHPPE
jgi:hypothetical protein